MTATFAAQTTDTAAISEAYERDGYFVLKSAFNAEQIEKLREETLAICSGERGEIMGADIVSEGAKNAEEAMQRVLAIHFPHKFSEVMRSTLTEPAIVNALRAIIGPDIKCMQSMLFVKNAGKPGQAWHQDEFYIPTRDQSLAGVWIALDDARIDNGGLWMHPGSHKHGIIWPTHNHGDARFDSSQEAKDFPYEREGGVAVDADAGDVVIFHGYVLHRSLNNTRSEGYRRAIVNHVMNARSLLPWTLGFPPQPRDDFRDFEMISGEDPYAWKGKEESLIPFLRPEDPAQAARIFGAVMQKLNPG
ncbi:phytanoyl-CoA dioxygenase family protein [Erythrobacter ani]|uniref:Phytanoyl-CoA dioxygenase family protein n=1 Tax=Erythrobacter ani TaxID=2827235 RepID=A0ABS6SMB7_9SPHN|nr:phytanoyl-CoA dioxygenase family protein [Erythrobacter ani]